MRLSVLYEVRTAKFSKLLDYLSTGHSKDSIIWWIDGGQFNSQVVKDELMDTHPKILNRDPDFRGRYEPWSKKLVIFTRKELQRIPSSVWKILRYHFPEFIMPGEEQRNAVNNLYYVPEV